MEKPKRLPKDRQLEGQDLEVAKRYFTNRTLQSPEGYEFWVVETRSRGKTYCRLATNAPRVGVFSGMFESREKMLEALGAVP